MINELPKFSRVELVLGERVGKVASPLLKQGSMTLEAALAAAYPIAARQLIDAGENPQEVEAAVARQVASHGILPEHQTFAISEVLHAALLTALSRRLARCRRAWSASMRSRSRQIPASKWSSTLMSPSTPASPT